MKVGFIKTSLVDYPAHLASAIFLPGCNLRCPWCQNAELVLEGQNASGLVELEDALTHIEKRKNLLGGVALSGGEPCLYPDLAPLIARIKSFSLSVKLDTNGLFPDVLRNLLADEKIRPDYIAMDLKIAPSRYAELLPGSMALSDTKTDLAALLTESAALIRAANIEHEFRTLNLPSSYFSQTDIDSLRPLARKSRWNFREFRAGATLVKDWGTAE
jgi:pyruvate formate lyase activating enzyme